eukprot:409407_1
MSLSEKEWLITASPATIYTNQFFSSLAFLHNFIVFVYIVHQNCKSTELSSTQQFKRTLLIWNLVSIGSFIPFSFGLIAISFEYFKNHLECRYCYLIATTTYWLAKYTIWMYSIVRVKVVFDDSTTLQYSPKLLLLFQTLFHVFLGINIFLSIFAPEYKVISIGNHMNSMSFCIMIVPYWINAIAFAMDSAATVICFYLFQKKIQLLLSIQSKENNNVRNDFLNLLRKYKVLLITVTVSSWILGTSGTFTCFACSLGAIDSIINIWCLVLFDIRYNKLYQRMFRCCISSSPSTSTQTTLQMTIR